MYISHLRRIRHMPDLKTASTIATSVVHAKLDYCNSLVLNIDITQINRLQAMQNALARAVTVTPKHSDCLSACFSESDPLPIDFVLDKRL